MAGVAKAPVHALQNRSALIACSGWVRAQTANPCASQCGRWNIKCDSVLGSHHRLESCCAVREPAHCRSCLHGVGTVTKRAEDAFGSNVRSIVHVRTLSSAAQLLPEKNPKLPDFRVARKPRRCHLAAFSCQGRCPLCGRGMSIRSGTLA